MAEENTEHVQYVGLFMYMDLDQENPYRDVVNVEEFYHRVAATHAIFPYVKETKERAFAQCSDLHELDFRNLETIGKQTFYGCTSIEAFDLPKTTTIGESAFQACIKATSFNLPLATTAGDMAFRTCESLKTIDLPRCTSLGAYCFAESVSLEYIYAYAVTSIGARCFQECKGLYKLELPYVADIPESTFQDDLLLGHLNIQSATSLGKNSLVGTHLTYLCLKSMNWDDVLPVRIGWGLDYTTTIVCKDKVVTTINGVEPADPPKKDYLVYGTASVSGTSRRSITGVLQGSNEHTQRNPATNKYVLKGIELLRDDYAWVIGENAFKDNIDLDPSQETDTSFRNILFPQVVELKAGAFSGCTSLKTATLPNLVTVGDGAFTGCPLKHLAIASITSATALASANRWGIQRGCEMLCKDRRVVVP